MAKPPLPGYCEPGHVRGINWFVRNANMSFGAFNRTGITADGHEGMAAYGVSGDWDGKTPPLFRLSLFRLWDSSLPAVLIIGTNPSDEATHEQDDAQLSDWIDMARNRGFGKLWVGCLYPLRTSYIENLKAYYHNPDGLKPHQSATIEAINLSHLESMAHQSQLIVGAWSDEDSFFDQAYKVSDYLDRRLPRKLCVGINEWP